jgi:CHAT domain-containing protein
VRDWLAAPAGPEKLRLARELHQVLFGHWTGPIQNAPLWLLVADGDLFEAPLAALVTGFKSLRPIYLAERHALQFVPGSWALERRRLTVRTGRFLGIADPIYNQADPRRSQRWPWADDGASQLTRLASSEAEVRACARYWTSQETLLGERAMPDVVSQQLGRSPAVIHLALHVVPAPDSARENMVALGAGLEGRPAYVGTEWIGAHRLPGSLVVMNGCRSGSGVISAGEGLMGLTRAWLRAGASRVLSTYWPTLDDGGALTSEFYRQLTTNRFSTAEALRRAQLAMIAHGDWRADPRYWAAYFLIGSPALS